MTAELRILLRLGLPVVAGQLGMMLLHSVDTLMLGRYGVQELAAAALGTQWIFLTLTLGFGLVMGIDPLVAQRHGAADHFGTGRALQQGLFMAALASVGISVAWFGTESVLLGLGQDPELSRLAHRYTVIQLPSVFPFLAWVALRSYLQGREIVAPAMWVMLPVNLLNGLFNWLFIFGPGAFPEWGLDGAALATCLSRLFTGGLLLVWILAAGLHRGAWPRPHLSGLLQWSELRTPMMLGIPIAVQMGLEVTAFALTAVVAGRIGAQALAAHSIVLSFSALMFMMPLGVAIGTTTRVGNLLGAGKLHRLGKALIAAFVFGAAVIALNVTLLVVGRYPVVAAYTEDATVRALATATFLVAAAFQASDCTQIVAGGALRGMGRTRSPAIATFIGYYAFGLPAGYYWGVIKGHGLVGLWWGLALGLTMVAIGLVLWLSFVLRDKAPLLRDGEPQSGIVGAGP